MNAHQPKMKLISIVTACFNEEENVETLYERVKAQIEKLGRYRYEHIFIDNCSTDGTVSILKGIAAKDPRVKIIVNARNFGHIRSPMHALMQATGDAIIGIVADLQDPPELIPDIVERWEQGYAMVLCVKRRSEEHPAMFWVRKQYYRAIEKISETRTFENFTGFGLYDRRVVEAIRAFDDPYPYFRGMIAEIGLPSCELLYDQPRREHGVTKNNLYTLYDMGMLAITQLSKIPLRFVTFVGFVSSLLSVLAGIVYFVYKLVFWSHFTVGIAPVVIGMFFFASVQMLSLGIIGEYVGSIYTHVRKRPYVIERERVNFDRASEDTDAKISAAVPIRRRTTA
jgi:glycosyltransferase involved in cell wall biosynthesis